jgi:hypothetical protein
MPRLILAAAALAGLGALLGAPPAAACGWLWPCADRSAYRDAPSAAYRGCPGRRRAYGCRDSGGYGYAPWYGTSRARVWQPRSALPAESTREVGLTPPITSAQGLLYGGMPAYGPTLFGPSPPPPGYGYSYRGGYYGYPAYGYYGYDAPRGGPPPETPSWWVEPRRRR